MNEKASMIMRFVPHLLGIGVLLFAATDAPAKPAYATSTVNLRAAPGTTSEIVAKIPGGARVEAGECTDGWCEVTWQGKSGFSIATSLDMSGRPRRSYQLAPHRRAVGPNAVYTLTCGGLDGSDQAFEPTTQVSIPGLNCEM